MTNNQSKPSFSVKHPIWYVTIVEVLLILALFIAGAYATVNELDALSPVLFSFPPIALAIMIYLTMKKKWGYLGFRSITHISRQSWMYYIPLLVVLVLLSLKGFKELTVSDTFYYIGFTLLVGFVEETIYRGLILKALLNKSVKVAVITSSVLFGITHILNAMSGKSAFDTSLQIVYALMIGLSLALLMVKENNIYPLIAFHFIHNLIQFLGNEDEGLVVPIIVIVVLIVQCIWIMKDLNRKKGVASQSELSSSTLL